MCTVFNTVAAHQKYNKITLLISVFKNSGLEIVLWKLMSSGEESFHDNKGQTGVGVAATSHGVYTWFPTCQVIYQERDTLKIYDERLMNSTCQHTLLVSI